MKLLLEIGSSVLARKTMDLNEFLPIKIGDYLLFTGPNHMSDWHEYSS